MLNGEFSHADAANDYLQLLPTANPDVMNVYLASLGKVLMVTVVL